MKSKLVFQLLLIFLSFKIYSQDYVIVKLYMKNNAKLDGEKFNQWIIPVDSLENFKNEHIYPLMITDFSFDNLTDCIKNKKIDPFSFSSDTSFDFPKGFIQTQGNISKEITSHKKLIQVINKKWKNGYKERIKVYVIPVKGDFCNCELYTDLRNDFFYQGRIYIGKGEIKYDDSFWKSKNLQSLISIDFARLNNFNRIFN